MLLSVGNAPSVEIIGVQRTTGNRNGLGGMRTKQRLTKSMKTTYSQIGTVRFVLERESSGAAAVMPSLPTLDESV